VAVAVVASAQEKEEIVRILAESLLCVLRRYRASFLTVTGSAGSAVAAEGRELEELLAVRWIPGGCRRILRETTNTHQTNQAGTTEQYYSHVRPPRSSDMSQWKAEKSIR
jgi:hypothetical protein